MATSRPALLLQLLVLSSASLLMILININLARAQTCGSQAGGAICPNNACCSQWGYCGTGSAYCGTGCQSGPCPQCSATVKCPNNACCSQYGYCGTSSAYCGTGCQSGPCTTTTSTNGQCSATIKCPNNACCSQWGYCGTGSAYCGTGCLSGPCTTTPSPPPPPPTTTTPPPPTTTTGSVSSIITSAIFDQFLPQRTASGCPANGFYTYASFIAAAAAFSGFGTSGTSAVQKRELAAFFANIAHETGSGCYVEEINKADYCDTSSGIPCAAGKQYYGRGPMQLSWNYNYKPAGIAIGFDGINNPGIVSSDATVSFKTAVWYWMTQHSPTCHAAMVNGLGFGATINTINGGLECGSGGNQAQQQSRINLYTSYCAILGVDPGSNLTC